MNVKGLQRTSPLSSLAGIPFPLFPPLLLLFTTFKRLLLSLSCLPKFGLNLNFWKWYSHLYRIEGIYLEMLTGCRNGWEAQLPRYNKYLPFSGQCGNFMNLPQNVKWENMVTAFLFQNWYVMLSMPWSPPVTFAADRAK